MDYDRQRRACCQVQQHTRLVHQSPPRSYSMTRKRRSPVIESACADCLPSCVSPVRAVIGLGTISCNAASFPRHSSREQVLNTELFSPQHKSGLPGKSASINLFCVRCIIFKPNGRNFPEINQSAASRMIALILFHVDWRPRRTWRASPARLTRFPCCALLRSTARSISPCLTGSPAVAALKRLMISFESR